MASSQHRCVFGTPFFPSRLPFFPVCLFPRNPAKQESEVFRFLFVDAGFRSNRICNNLEFWNFWGRKKEFGESWDCNLLSFLSIFLFWSWDFSFFWLNFVLVVGNIPYDATEEQLIEICQEVGPVVSFRYFLNPQNCFWRTLDFFFPFFLFTILQKKARIFARLNIALFQCVYLALQMNWNLEL